MFERGSARLEPKGARQGREEPHRERKRHRQRLGRSPVETERPSLIPAAQEPLSQQEEPPTRAVEEKKDPLTAEARALAEMSSAVSGRTLGR